MKYAIIFLGLFPYILFAQPSYSTTSDFLTAPEIIGLVKTADWDELLRKVPNDSLINTDPRVSLLKAHAYYAMQNYNLATALFHSAVDPSELKQWEEWTTKLLKSEPSNAVYSLLAADGLARTGKFAEALPLLKPLTTDPVIAHLAYTAQGVIYDILDQEEAAEASFFYAAETNPNFLDPIICLGILDLERGFVNDEADFFVDALRADSTIALAYNGEACRQALLNRRQRAVELVIKANEYLPLNPYIIVNARVLHDSTHANSALDSIASLKISERGAAYLGRGIASFAPDKITAGYSASKGLYGSASWDISRYKQNAISFYNNLISNPSSNWLARGGIFFHFGKFESTHQQPRRIATEFVLGYLRPSEKGIEPTNK